MIDVRDDRDVANIHKDLSEGLLEALIRTHHGGGKAA
jgi:hypothetical protein